MTPTPCRAHRLGGVLAGLLVPGQAALAEVNIAGEVERQPLNPVAITLFLVFVVATLAISYWASRRTRSSGDFYNAGGQITGLQNGTAIAGEFMSAASFLGITGLIFLGGFDGLLLALGAFSAWPLMLILLARRVRNLGRFTFVDVVSTRLESTRIRLLAIVSTIVVVILYLIAQMVGAGKLIQLLFGLPYEVAVVAVSALVLAYVTFGGMLATTWIQIIKAILLISGVTVTAFLVLLETGFNLNELFAGAVANHPRGERILAPGLLFNDPVQVATILVSMLFGTLGLPHILMRLYTVPNMREAKKSAFYASLFMGYFYLVLIVLGFGTVALLYRDPAFFSTAGGLIGGSNMAAIHLASAVGGDLLTGFMAAVTFATILAVVAGLTVSGAAAISHDFYAEVLCKGQPDSRRELLLTRVTTVAIGVIAVVLGILFQDENVAFIATMPMVVAASVNFPVLFLSLFWPGLTTRGAIVGATVGLIASVALIVVGPQVWVSVLGFERALFPYDYPALFTLPLALVTIWLVSRFDRSEQAAMDRSNYHAQLVRSEYGPEDGELEVARH
ncbi:sodium:solute symporter family transporter [Kineobactrum salinum]|uniref:Cation/acetate symporter ActP n=1 Tax=Kineobactrum salinum TaxID=2708301 RepID=A0A6C0TYM2_9GAMM|nr:cation/acetate symporter ActP [Kineobactrum salinum]QIB64932.1 cation/acetate symporter ActP [Kineobactrum salinum]